MRKTEPFSQHAARAAGETVETILKPDCDHHPHSLSDPSPIVRFAEDAFRETQS